MFTSLIDSRGRGKCRARLLHTHYLTARSRISPPFGKSRRACHESNGQLVNKCSLSTQCGLRTGCYPPTNITERKKNYYSTSSAARAHVQILALSLSGCDLGQVTLTLPALVSSSINGGNQSVCHMCLWEMNSLQKALEQ